MSRKLFGVLVAVGFGLFVSAGVFACPDDEKHGVKKESTPPAAEVAKGGCSKPCAHGAGAATATTEPKDGRSESTEVKSDKPCHEKNAALASDKAEGKGCCGGNKKCGPGCAKSALSEGGCPINKKVQTVLASLPAMKYRVGELVTDCPKDAAAKSDATGKTIEFVVGDSAFKEKGEAAARLASLLDAELGNMQTVQYVAGGKCMKCPMSAKSVAAETKTEVAYRVGGVDFTKQEDAEKALAAIAKVVADVHMEYKVGDKTYNCDKTAGDKAKENGGKITYVVAGEETCCPTTAKLKLAEAKVRRIVEAAVQASFAS